MVRHARIKSTNWSIAVTGDVAGVVARDLRSTNGLAILIAFNAGYVEARNPTDGSLLQRYFLDDGAVTSVDAADLNGDGTREIVACADFAGLGKFTRSMCRAKDCGSENPVPNFTGPPIIPASVLPISMAMESSKCLWAINSVILSNMSKRVAMEMTLFGN